MRSFKTVLILDVLFVASLLVFAGTREWMHRAIHYEFLWAVIVVWGLWGGFGGLFNLLWFWKEQSGDGVPSSRPVSTNSARSALKFMRYQWTSLPFVFALGVVYANDVVVTPMMKVFWPLVAGILAIAAWHWQVWRRFGVRKA